MVDIKCTLIRKRQVYKEDKYDFIIYEKIILDVYQKIIINFATVK